MKIIILSLLVTLPAIAQKFERLDNALFLKSADCNETQGIVSAAKDWAVRIKNSECHISEMKSQHNTCQTLVKNCFPKKIEDVLGLTPKTSGPNCHNFAFVAQGISKSIRHANYNEAVNTYNSPLCQRLEIDKEILPGDIGRIGDSMLNSHSFIYLDNDFILSKNGDSRSDFNVFPANEVYAGYGVQISDGCLKAKFRRGENCPTGVDYYRCTSFDEYIDASDTPEHFKNAFNNLNSYEELAECRSLTGLEINSYATANLVSDSLIILNKYLDTQIEQIITEDKATQENLFLLTNLLDRISSLNDQFSFNDAGGLKYISDFSNNNISKETGLPISSDLDGRWQKELQSKKTKLYNKLNPPSYFGF